MIIQGKKYPTHKCVKCGYEWKGCEASPNIDQQTADSFKNLMGYDCKAGDVICLNCYFDLWELDDSCDKTTESN